GVGAEKRRILRHVRQIDLLPEDFTREMESAENPCGFQTITGLGIGDPGPGVEKSRGIEVNERPLSVTHGTARIETGIVDRSSEMELTIADRGKEYHASVRAPGPVVTQVCGVVGEQARLNHPCLAGILGGNANT